MKKAASIFLRADITPADLNALILWMSNPNVTLFLNEDPQIISHLTRLSALAPGPMLTYHFNQHGRFYLICPEDETAVGFVSLRPADAPASYEIVYAIGEESLWGLGLGEGALRAALAAVFLDGRARRVLARVHFKNDRSLRALRSCGFHLTGSLGVLRQYEITLEEYLCSLRSRTLRP